METENLLNAEIYGPKQRRSVWYDQPREEINRLLSGLTPKRPKLNDRELIDLRNSRLGRSIAEQAQKVLALCRKLKGYLRVVERDSITGNPSDVNKMRCALGLLSDVIKVSHFFDAIRNDKYVVGKPFPYLRPFQWLNRSTKKLDLAEMETNNTIESTTENVHDGIEANTKVCDDAGALESGKQVVVDNVDTLVARKEKYIIERRNVATNKRPEGVKAAKAENRAKAEWDEENDAFNNAIYSLSDKVGEVSSVTTEAANVRH